MALPVLRDGTIVVRPLRRSDEEAWMALRRDNRAWLVPWEATAPPGPARPPATFASFVRSERRAWRDKTTFAGCIEVDGELVGRVSLAGIHWGAECGGSIGYWIAEAHAGRGIVPRAVRLLIAYGFAQGLHRIEIAVRPENDKSIRVVEKLGFRDEGLRRSYLYIDGGWRDHRVFALTADEPRRGLLGPSSD